jgi:autotransporter passenger strand-loop-strand repeat protein
VADPTTIFSGGTETIRAGGTDDGARISRGGKLFIQSGGTAIDITIFSGGTAINSASGSLDVVVSATDSGALVNSGAVNVRNGATLTLGGTTLNNAGSINLFGSSSQTTVFIAHNVTLSGGGTVAMSGGSSLIIDSGGSSTLINVNDKIVGVGRLGGDPALFVINEAGGVIDGNGSGIFGTLEISATVTNAGLIEGTTSQGLAIGGGGLITNSGTIAALGTSAVVGISDVSVANSTTKALIVASGSGALVELGGATISGGTLKTSAGGTIVTVGDDLLSGVTVAASSLIEVSQNTLILSGGTIGAGAIIETTRFFTTATAIISGTVTNGGTLFASASGSLVEIASGAVVNGGLALIGDGIVDIAGSSGESVKFLSSGSGGLELDGVGSAYKGKVSGFGGSGHSKHDQFIDFTAIGSGASVSYTSAASHTSGTLKVTSGGVSATVTLIGTYSSTNFSSSTVGGHVRVTDPVVISGGSVESGAVLAVDAHSGIDVPDIAFGAQTTLAYAENGARIGGTLTVTDGRHAAAIALLGNYMAASFAMIADGHGGMLVKETPQTGQQPLLTHPRV